MCQLEKQHQHPFPSERNVSKGKYDIIHSDVWGPSQNARWGGSRYFITFTNDYTRHTWVYIIQRKSEGFTHFVRMKRMVENEMNRKIRCLRSDGGKEYFSNEFTEYLQRKGIRHEFSCRYTPKQNGVTERKNLTIVEMARAMLEEKKMPKIFWGEAVATTIHLLNRCSIEGVHTLTPHEIYFGKKPDLSHLKVFD